MAAHHPRITVPLSLPSRISAPDTSTTTQAPVILGPLTTAFVQPSYCNSLFISSVPDVLANPRSSTSDTYYIITRDATCGPSGTLVQARECFPDGTSMTASSSSPMSQPALSSTSQALVTQALGSQASESQALESPTSTSSGPMLYSPAAGCPIGYKTPVDQSQGETAIPCCPSGYTFGSFSTSDWCHSRNTMTSSQALLLQCLEKNGATPVYVTATSHDGFYMTVSSSMFVSSTVEAEPVWLMGMASSTSFAIPSSTSPARNITIPTAIRPEPEKGGIAAGPLAGIVVGSVIIGLLVIGIFVFFIFRRRRRRAEEAAVKEKPKPDPRQKRRVWI